MGFRGEGWPKFADPCHVGSSSDVYSLGCTFYKLVTGTNPIPGKTFLELHKNHLEWEPIPIEEINKTVPLSLRNIISKMMAKKPEDRYQNGTEVNDALVGLQSQRNFKWLKKSGLIFAAVLVVTLVFNRIRPRTEWFPKPRVIAVMPFTNEKSSYSFVSSEFTRLLAKQYPHYQTAERADIYDAMQELNLNQSDFISKKHGLRIGKLVGAHVFIMFESRTIKGREVVYPKAFDVETLLMLGFTKIPADVLEQYQNDNSPLKLSFDKIMQGIAANLTYRSYVASINGREVVLEHGGLYGVTKDMKLRALDGKGDAIGKLEVLVTEKDKATAKIISDADGIEEGLRVEEVKE